MTQDRIELQYVTGGDEFLQALQGHKAPDFTLKQRVLVGIAVLAGMFLFAWQFDWVIEMHLLVLGVLAGAFLVLVYWKWSHQRLVKHVVSIAMRCSANQGPLTVTFTDAGIAVSSEVGSSETSWLAVDGLVPARSCTLINLGTTFMPIPDEALPVGMSREAFIAHLEKWKSAS